MRVAFRDFFYWALVGETTDPEVASTCTSACGEITNMCCATILMKNDKINSYEKHCINQGVVQANFAATIGDYDVSMKCDSMSSGAIMKAASFGIAGIAALALY
jgi:roadblock/LC7 domain-containing protein